MMTYQVLLQLFVVGNDAIMDDDKFWAKTQEWKDYRRYVTAAPLGLDDDNVKCALRQV